MRSLSTALLVALVLAACGDPDEAPPGTFITFFEGGSVVSEDGRLRVDFPPGALPASATVRVVRLSEPIAAGVTTPLVYRIEPRELRLDATATATWSLQPGDLDVAAPLTMLSAASDASTLSADTARAQAEGGTLVFPLERLGDVALHPAWDITPEARCREECHLQKRLPLTLRFQLHPDIASLLDPDSTRALSDIRVAVETSTPLGLEGSRPSDRGGTTVRRRSLALELAEGDAVSFEYFCRDAGEAELNLVATAGVEIDAAPRAIFTALPISCRAERCDDLGAACEGPDACCSDTCEASACAPPPRCDPERDDDVAAQPSNATPLFDATQRSEPLLGCSGTANQDVFSVELEAGQPVGVELEILDADPLLGSEPRVSNLDLIILDGDTPLGSTVGSSRAVERLDVTATRSGTHHVIVTSLDGSVSPYRIRVAEGTPCVLDADCLDPGAVCELLWSIDEGRIERTCQRYQPIEGCALTTEEGDAYSDSRATPLLPLGAPRSTTATVTGSTCHRDYDVFSFDLEARESASIEIRGEPPGLDALIATLIDPEGAVVEQRFIELGGNFVGFDALFIDTPGRWLVHIQKFQPAPEEDVPLDYDLRLRRFDFADTCARDQDCGEGERCGHLRPLQFLPFPFCSSIPETPCGGDGDDTFATAAPLPLDTPTESTSCVGDFDHFRLTLTEPWSDLRLDVPARQEDEGTLVIALYDETGYRLGHSTNQGALRGFSFRFRHLRAGDYVVRTYLSASGPRRVTDAVTTYELLATATPDTACAQDIDCTHRSELVTREAFVSACDVDTGGCVDPNPGLTPDSVPDGGACTEDHHCQSGYCLGGICTITCREGQSADCEQVFDPGGVECRFFSLNTSLCQPRCGEGFLFDDVSCTRVDGALCDQGSGLCL